MRSKVKPDYFREEKFEVFRDKLNEMLARSTAMQGLKYSDENVNANKSNSYSQGQI
jgi:hypothetical protein